MSTFTIQIDASKTAWKGSPADLEFPFGKFMILESGQTLHTAAVESVALESGKDFHLLCQSGVVPDWTFRLSSAGDIEYRDEFDVTNGGFLEGRGTKLLKLRGYAVTFDAQQLFGGGVVLNVLDDKFGSIGLKTFRLLPQRNYQVLQGSGTAANFPFTVTLPSLSKAKPKGGVFDYDKKFDVCNDPRGFAAGRLTTRLQFVGYPIFLNACAAGALPVVSNVGSIIVNNLPVLTFLPGTGSYRIEVIRGTNDLARLDFFIDQKGEITKVSVDPALDPFSLKVETTTRPALTVVLRHNPPS